MALVISGADEALQKIIDARVSKTLQALVSRLPVAPPTPTPNNNTLENPRSGLVNSGGTLSEPQEGEPGNSNNSHLQNLLLTLQKQLKEHNERIEQIPGVPPVIKGVDVDKYSQQPWKPSTAPLPIPKKFKIPDISKYDGTTDPRDHVTAFTTGVKGNDLTKQEIESVLVKKYGETLTKGVLTWYSLLPENSVNSFAELANSFIKAHSGAQKVEKRMKDIFKVKQGDTKLLRDFVDRFQRERMTLPRVPDNWAAIAFASILNDKSLEATRRLRESLREFPATTWNDVYNRYNTKLRIEEDTVPQFHHEERSKSRRSEIEKRSGKNRQETPKPPSPKRTVNVISGGEDIHGATYTASNKVSKVMITHGKRLRQVLENESISFDDADTEGVMTPHNDALVISLPVHDTNVKRVLIDPGSSVNIILLRVLREMQAEDKMIPKAHTLSGFDNSSVVTKGDVILIIFAAGVVKETKFQVVYMEMAYNMIMGRPWIHDMDAVPSTLHQVIKFPSPWGIYQIRGDQQTSRSINAVTDTSTVNKEK
ncbi:uncharacterized protein [Nicotiana sylvestris]|uniref:uncharacterized protein n=1 Tax=Nicotiana sylvestris TaxID=4096 RepID=UPI00388CA4B8